MSMEDVADKDFSLRFKEVTNATVQKFIKNN